MKKCENCEHSQKTKRPDYPPQDDGVHQVFCTIKDMNVPKYFVCGDYVGAN